MPAEAVELFFAEEFDAFATCESALQLLEAAGLTDSPFEIAGRKAKVAADKLVAKLSKLKDPFFWVDSDRVTLKTTPYRAGGASITVKFRNVQAPARDVLDEWLPTALEGHGRFARLFDSEWEQWQNETQISKFGLVGRSAAGLKRTWDPVFEEEIIDTSANSGRFLVRDGYLE